jgi:hypothetical protein
MTVSPSKPSSDRCRKATELFAFKLRNELKSLTV